MLEMEQIDKFTLLELKNMLGKDLLRLVGTLHLGLE